jgi:hypothetical protein
MAFFADKSKKTRWFVVQDGEGDTHLLTWLEFNCDWVQAGYIPVDWFKANSRPVARVKMQARGNQRGYLSPST